MPDAARLACLTVATLAIGLPTIGVGVASAAAWQPFGNPRFGFWVDIPANYRAGPPPENGDGRTFTSPDGAVTVRAYGSNLADPGAFAADAVDTVAAETQNGLAITYRAIGRDRYTLSGTVGTRIVYLHAVPTCGKDSVATVRIDYPAVLKAKLDPLVAHMAETLRGSGRCG